jgi:hypothetical protein
VDERGTAGPAHDARASIHTRVPIPAVLCLFFLLSVCWTFAVPVQDSQGAPSIFQPDEPNHIAVIAYIAQKRALPPYTFAYYESAHPPLYHLAAAGLYHYAQPVLGSDASVILLRLVGGGLGTILVWLVWQTALPLVGKQGALLSAVIVGSIPMFVSLSASVTNETLAALAGAGALSGLTAGVQRRHFDWRTLNTLAFWTAVGAGTKVTCLGLLPVSLGVVWAVGYNQRARTSRIAVQLGLIVLITATLSGWWYARNVVLYGDPFRRAEAAAMWHKRIPGYETLSAQGKTTAARYTARVTFWGWASFWGIFDAAQRPLPAWIYGCIAAFQAVSLYGLVKFLRQSGLRQNGLWPLVAAAAPFAAAVAIVYYRYTWDHYTPQGRFFFPLLLPFAILTAVGWISLWTQNEKSGGGTPFLTRATVPLMAAFVLLNCFVLVRTVIERAAGVPAL